MNQETILNQEISDQELQDAIKTQGSVKAAVKYLNDKFNAEETVVNCKYMIDCFQLEGAYALHQAVGEIIGFVDLTAKSGASGDNPPQLLDVPLPDGTSIKVPWGRVTLPGDGSEVLDMDYDPYDVRIRIRGKIKKKSQKLVDSIVDLTKKNLANRSIYKGRAFTLEFEDDEVYDPQFLDLDNIDEAKILLPQVAKDGLVPILSRICNTKECVEQGLDLKYGALMEGPYGTGKTLTAFLIAKYAIQNGWTFIYLKDCNNMGRTLTIAENFCKGDKGIVIFTEDIDQALRGKRDGAMQKILNTLDGGDTKGMPIISIFTTNHIELIEPTFMRGKRIGGLISLGPLDFETAQKFITNLVIDAKGDTLMEDGDCSSAAEALVGIVPAFASEVIDKAKAYMIHRKSNKISCEDIIKAAESYKKQMSYAELKKVDETEKSYEKAVKLLFGNGMDEDGVKNFYKDLARRLDMNNPKL